MPMTYEEITAAFSTFKREWSNGETSAEAEWGDLEGYTQSDSGELHPTPGHPRWQHKAREPAPISDHRGRDGEADESQTTPKRS